MIRQRLTKKRHELVDCAKEKRQHIYKPLRYLQPLQNPTMALKRAWKSCIRTGCIWTFKHYTWKILSYIPLSVIAWPSTLLFESGTPNWKRTTYSNLIISDSSFAERWASAQLLCQKLASKRIVFYFYVIPEIHFLDKTCLPSSLRVYVHNIPISSYFHFGWGICCASRWPAPYTGLKKCQSSRFPLLTLW